jgi:hypothetical protein
MIKLEMYSRPKNQAMGGAAEVKHSDLITFPHVLAFVGDDLARRNFGHSHGQQAHQPDTRVIRFDKD